MIGGESKTDKGEFGNWGQTKDEEKCGEDNLPCEVCGYNDCKESEKCKWSSGSGNGKWTPIGPSGVCKPKDEDKCGENNRPCEDCGYYDCKESEKCQWFSVWTGGVCKPIGCPSGYVSEGRDIGDGTIKSP